MFPSDTEGSEHYSPSTVTTLRYAQTTKKNSKVKDKQTNKTYQKKNFGSKKNSEVKGKNKKKDISQEAEKALSSGSGYVGGKKQIISRIPILSRQTSTSTDTDSLRNLLTVQNTNKNSNSEKLSTVNNSISTTIEPVDKTTSFLSEKIDFLTGTL